MVVLTKAPAHQHWGKIPPHCSSQIQKVMDVVKNNPVVPTQFLTIQEFKTAFGCQTISIVKNPNTGKLFGSCSNGKVIRVKQTLNMALPMSVLIPDGVLEDACIINGSGANVLVTL